MVTLRVFTVWNWNGPEWERPLRWKEVLKYEDNNVPSFLFEVSFENNFPK